MARRACFTKFGGQHQLVVETAADLQAMTELDDAHRAAPSPSPPSVRL